MDNSLPTSTPTAQCRCPNSQLKVYRHPFEQRYISPTTGKCKPLVVQCINPKYANERPISQKTKQYVRLAISLVKNPPKTMEDTLFWIMRWAWYVIALLMPSTTPPYTGMYKPYLRHYVGQLWAARSVCEYSQRVPAGELESDTRRTTHTVYPRTLVTYNPATEKWALEMNPNIIKQQHYVTISFRWADIFFPWEADQVKEQKSAGFIADVRRTMWDIKPEGQDVYAYWLDMECSGENAEDVYRMADIYRHSEFTLIMLPDNGQPLEARWEAYGSRIWTFPEALLSRRLRYKAGSGPVLPLNLHGLATFAYRRYEMESALINTYGTKKDPLERLERLLQLKAAIWRRASGLSAEELTIAREKAPHRDWTTPQENPADKVYALMGFFEHRIKPDPLETELQALARLSMANDSDRIAERMISMLPDSTNEAAWYTDADYYSAKLWDIEPECQVCGITASGALVLDGCRAASIRWKGFPKTTYAMKSSLLRSLARAMPSFFWFIVLIGIALTALGVQGGVAPLIVGIILFMFAPFMTAYGHSGRVILVQPWLVGVKGYLSAEKASEYLYGGDPRSTDRTLYTPSGSPYSEPETSREFRRGFGRQRNAQDLEVRYGTGDLFTLIDTRSRTIYYFRAENPPTVCVYMGREGGLGRYVLCSEQCWSNELRKETVLRMPSYISKSMYAVDWVAVGGVARV